MFVKEEVNCQKERTWVKISECEHLERLLAMIDSLIYWLHRCFSATDPPCIAFPPQVNKIIMIIKFDRRFKSQITVKPVANTWLIMNASC